MPETRGIDHIVHCVRDLDAAIARLEAFGFTLTPRALHPFGTGNALVQLQGNFIELLAIVEPEKIAGAAAGGFSFGAFCRDFLDRREGMSMLVFESRNAQIDHGDFMEAGLTTYPVFDFARKATLPDGTEAEVAFSLAFVTHDEMPQSAFFTCQQHAPEHFWKPEYQTHANGAQAIAEIVMIADRPADWRGLFEGLQGAGSVGEAAGALTVQTNRGQVTVMNDAGFAARFPGEAPPINSDGPVFAAAIVSVADMDMLRRALITSGVAVGQGADGQPFVPAADAFGLVLGFTPLP
ncbi:MAG TPA: VOC family protein [Alphaproteobacteria bacterium]|nr:VOC family protein [Alphaproteobacteria bacterium]